MADDKFIMMGLNDDTRNIAEILKNPTCKKILDFLGDVKEASEKDISDGLNIAINTVEYNLNKLIKAGLVEKTKNFFWSVKGKKIPMYKLAKRHIIISHKKPSLSYLKTILPMILVVVLLAALIISLFPGEQPVIDQSKLKQFSSQSDLEGFVKEHIEAGGFRGDMMVAETMAASPKATATGDLVGGGAAEDFSQTNIQVEGVDEPDIVKNDGKYIYKVLGKKVAIVLAYPAENMKILSEIDLNVSVNEIFINDDKLIVFTSGYDYMPNEDCVIEENVKTTQAEMMPERYCGGYYKYKNIIYIYDVSDRENPELEQEIENDGSYVDSRMIGDYVYVISTKYVAVDRPEPPVYMVNGVEKKISAEEVYYFDYPDTSYVFTLITAIDVNTGEFNGEVYLTGSTRTLYVSQDNIYLTYQKSMRYDKYIEDMIKEVLLPLLPNNYDDEVKKILDSDEDIYEKYRDIGEIVEKYSKSLTGNKKSEFDKELMERAEDFQIKIQKETEKTVVHKININKDKINYEGVGEVPGSILNQFSMDEYKGHFRIATTTGHVSRAGGGSLNHLYILGKDLEIVGKVEDLAEGERIYSVRFMGKRAYVVTFKKIDPLFVIDVSDPEEPEVLGYLKITGYSDYLHIYDENHIIGLGKETIASEQGNFAWYQGIKISLFDVSDVENPIEKAKIEIGDRGTDSYALHDHHAFLFDKGKNLLVIPISLAEIDEEKLKERYGDNVPDWATGERVWQGAYVLDISLDGIEVRGKITHDDTGEEKGSYYYGSKYAVQRSLYMDDVLYTISTGKIKANNLESIDEINSVELPYEENYYSYYETI